MKDCVSQKCKHEPGMELATPSTPFRLAGKEFPYWATNAITYLITTAIVALMTWFFKQQANNLKHIFKIASFEKSCSKFTSPIVY